MNETSTGNGTLSPDKIASVFYKSGFIKAQFSTSQFFVYALLGGAFIALGGLLALFVSGGMPTVAATAPGITKFIAGALFPIGLVLVIIAGGSLFTSDCAVLPYALWQQKLSLGTAGRIAVVGYFANFAGALLVAWLLAVQTGTLTPEPWRTSAINLALHKTHSSFWTVFAKGIGANMMVCLAVWMAYASDRISGKVILIWMPVMAFVALGWEHSIANMFFIPTAMMLGAPISLADFLWHNLVPATLGNIAGGMLLVALPYYFLYGKKQSKTADIFPEIHTNNKHTHTAKKNTEKPVQLN
ncbi:MAG: formate/nitrite transporter family protein [Bacteroidetes bacterium]|uniref:formate/nitrite transporter family protein n=1 Tax=Phnomibacter sp. TaxID=2836217 RepID=UPI002FDDA482|nr:formate/nitrite transporter family protein [Bacteroidota bacterium]